MLLVLPVPVMNRLGSGLHWLILAIASVDSHDTLTKL
jgi:hypothetical protein